MDLAITYALHYNNVFTAGIDGGKCLSVSTVLERNEKVIKTGNLIT